MLLDGEEARSRSRSPCWEEIWRCLACLAPDEMRRESGEGRGAGGSSLFSFQYTACGSADNVGFLTSDLTVCVSETLRGVVDGGFCHRGISKNTTHPSVLCFLGFSDKMGVLRGKLIFLNKVQQKKRGM